MPEMQDKQGSSSGTVLSETVVDGTVVSGTVVSETVVDGKVVSGKVVGGTVVAGIEKKEKTKAQLKAERKAIHEAKLAEQKAGADVAKSKAELKLERRNVQEAQRVAKESTKSPQPNKPSTNQTPKQSNTQPTNKSANQSTKKPTNEPINTPTNKPTSQSISDTKKPYKKPYKRTSYTHLRQLSIKDPYLDPKKQVAFFKHLYISKSFISSDMSHMRFTHTALRNTLTPNHRVIGLAKAIEQLLIEYETPAKKAMLRDFPKVLQRHLDHLHKARPMCISTLNFSSHLSRYVSKIDTCLESKTDDEVKELLQKHLSEYTATNISKAGVEIVEDLLNHIQNGDVIMVFGFSTLLVQALMESKKKGISFEVVVVDGRPKLHGIAMVERLRQEDITCTYSLVSAVPFYIRQVSKVVIDADSVFSNGSVLAPVGTSLLCLNAKLHVLPVLVICESYKLSESCHTDSIVYNELGDPHELDNHDNTHPSSQQLLPQTNATKVSCPLRLNVTYDVIPDDLVDLVITERGTLPSSSVSGIVRMKWAGAYA